MAIHVLIFLTALILTVISGLHFYWAFDGKWGIGYTIPDSYKNSFFDEKNKLKITIATVIVALGLLLFAFIIVSNYADWSSILSKSWTKRFTAVIGVIFLLRAIGDFNEFGLFRKQSGSKFTAKDKQLFVPLCLFLGLSSLLICIF